MLRESILRMLDDCNPETVGSEKHKLSRSLSRFMNEISQLINHRESEENIILRFIGLINAWSESVQKKFKSNRFCKHPDFCVGGDCLFDWFRLEVLKTVENTLGPLIPTNNIESFGWNVWRKLLEVKGVLHNLNMIKEEQLLSLFEAEIERALDFLMWNGSEKKYRNMEIAQWILERLKATIAKYKENKEDETLRKALVKGRIDKGLLGGEMTLIVGEDGGLYALLNNRSFLTDSVIKACKNVSDDYLESKSTFKRKNNKWQIIIGQGNFGKVRFALNLFDSENANPGDLLCVKKLNRSAVGAPSEAFELTASLLGEYFSKNTAEVIKAPTVLDVITESGKKKSYIFMEIFPQNSASIVFGQDSQYLKWEYQKPYLIEILNGMKKLISQNIINTDLKLENTLFDPLTKKAVIIDLGSTLKLNSRKELEQYSGSDEILITDKYCAPEVNEYYDHDQSKRFNWVKAMSFTLGKLIEATIAYNNKDEEPYSILKDLIENATLPNPDDRRTIEDMIETITFLGDLNEDSAIQIYIDRMSEIIIVDPTAVFLNEDLLASREIFINLDATKQNPNRFDGLKTYNLSLVIDDFFGDLKENVFLLLGSAGSGKSLMLQIKFYEAVKKWKSGDPVPVYFNMANETDLEKIIETLNIKLKTNLKLGTRSMHFYIDSFDEGFEMEKIRHDLINQYMRLAASDVHTVKILVSCRTEYLTSDTNLAWFTNERSKHKMITAFIAPLNYKGKQNLKELGMRWIIKNENRLGGDLKSVVERERLVAILQKEHIAALIDTGFMFEVIMNCLNTLSQQHQKNISKKTAIYKLYVEIILEESLKHLRKAKRQRILQILEKNCPSILRLKPNSEKNEEKRLRLAVESLGLNIALLAIKRNQHRLPVEECFPQLKFNPNKDFKSQEIYHILRLLPLKFEMKNRLGSLGQDVKIGFLHDTIKNIYVVKVMTNQILTGDSEQLLENDFLFKDVELMQFFIDALDDDLKKALKNLIFKTKKLPVSDRDIKLAANSMTILVSAKERLWSQDFSKINIRGANLTGGDFRKSNFQGADLSNCILHANFDNCNLSECMIIDVDLGINLKELRGHSDSVRGLAFSHDKKYLISASEDFSIGIWSLSSGKLIRKLNGHERDIMDMAMGSDGSFFATASVDGTVKIWDTKRCLMTLKDHLAPVISVAISPDCSIIASGGMDSRLCIWDRKEGVLFKRLEGHKTSIQAIDFSPSMLNFASGSIDGLTLLWDYETMSLKTTLQCSEQEVWSLCFSPDGTTLAAGYKSFCLLLWDLNSLNFIKLQGHHAGVTKIIFNKDGKKVISASLDHTLREWDRDSGNTLRIFSGGHTNGVLCVALSQDEKLLVSGSRDDTIRFWSLKVDESDEGHKNTIHSLCFSPDDSTLLSGSWDNSGIIWDMKSGLILQTFNHHKNWINSVAFSPNGKLIALASADETVSVMNTNDWGIEYHLKGHGERLRSVAFSRNSLFIATGANDNKVRLWKSEDGSSKGILSGHTDSVTCVIFSPCGGYVASSSNDKTIRIWEISDMKCIKTLTGHHNFVNCIDYSRDSNFLISASTDHTIRKWDVKNKRESQIMTGHKNSVLCIKYSPNGLFIASGGEDNLLIIWDGPSGAKIQTIDQHSNDVYSVAFSNDSSTLASGSRDKTIKVWRIDDTENKNAHGPKRDIGNNQGNSKNTKEFSLLFSLPNVRIGISAKGATLRNCIISKSLERRFVLNGALAEENFYQDEEEPEEDNAMDDSIIQERPRSSSSNPQISFPSGPINFGKDGLVLPGLQMPPHFPRMPGNQEMTMTGAPKIKVVSSLSFSPNGRMLACGTCEAKLLIWDVESATVCNFSDGHPCWVKSVYYSNNGQSIVTACGDTNVRVLDAATLEVRFLIEDHMQKVRDVCFSPDDSKFISCGNDSLIHIWDAYTSRRIATMRAGDRICSIDYSKQGNLIASGSCDCTIVIWNALSYKSINTLTGHTNFVESVCFSPNGKILVSGSFDCTIKKWRVDTGELLQTLTNHSGHIQKVAFFPDGKYFASCSIDQTLKIWDPRTGEIMQSINQNIPFSTLAISKDGKFLAAGGMNGQLLFFNQKFINPSGFSSFSLFKTAFI